MLLKNVEHQFKRSKPFYTLIIFIALVGLNYLFITKTVVMSIYSLTTSHLPANPFYLFSSVLVPLLLWLWSTTYDFFNYKNRKILFFHFVLLIFLTIFETQVLRIIMPLILPITLRIPLGPEISVSMVVNLTRCIISLIGLLPVLFLGATIYNTLKIPENRETISAFKVLKYLDTRRHKKYSYDLNVIDNLETGIPYRIKEADRTLHGFADGTTGTGKTSSVISVAICGDLEQRVYNQNYQKKCCYRMLKEGKLKVIKRFEDAQFSINYLSVVKGPDKKENERREKEFNFLKYTCKAAGITLLAPNEAFADEIYAMAKCRNLPVNRIDPIFTKEGLNKEEYIGFNPFYISPSITGINRDVDITNKANIFADVLQLLYDRSGSGDPYFVALNNTATINISKLLMLTFERLHKRQPHPGDFQICINDFSKCEPYMQVLVDLYGDNGKPMKPTSNMENRVQYITRQQEVNCGQWHDIYTWLKNDLLGSMRENMYDRSNGLRLQVNNFLNHPLIRKLICTENTIDLDRALANGEITIVNYALELGNSVSTAFGLFFILSFAKAVLRRPGTESTRTLHFMNMEEFSFLMHPALEEFFTLFRQYKVANFVAFQTLDQMEKNENTKYLKGILLGNCAHQIIFGRVSPSEMKIYQEMSGKVMKDVEQTTVSETSFTTENPNYNYSSRTTAQMSNVLEGHSIRNRDFQEVTVFTVDSGNPIPPFAGKVHFLTPRQRKGSKIQSYSWDNFLPAADEIVIKEPILQFKASAYVSRSIIKSSSRFSAKGIYLCDTSRELTDTPLEIADMNDDLLQSNPTTAPMPDNPVSAMTIEVPDCPDDLLAFIGDSLK